MERRSLKTIVFLIAISLMMAACAQPGATTAPSGQATTPPDAATEEPEAMEPLVLNVGAVADGYFNDPNDPERVGQASVGMVPVNTNIYETLVTMDENFQLVPGLATSWEYDADRQVWIFKLREGVTFHNGEPFTAADVVYTMNDRATGLWGSLIGNDFDENSTTAVGDFTVEIATSNVQATGQLAHPLWGIRANGTNPYEGEHVGTGRFMFKEYEPENFISVTKFEGYWGEPAAVDEVMFRFMPDPNTRVLALEAGEVDAIYDIPLEGAASLDGIDSVQLHPATVSAYQAISVNVMGEEPYDIVQDVKIREAIGYAIDRPTLIDIALDGFAEDSQTFMPAALLAENAALIEGYTYDADRANSLLDEAGWVDGDGDGVREKDGRPLTLELINGFPTCNDNGQTAEVVQAQLAEVGIEVTITCISDYAAYEQRLADLEGDLFLEIGNQNSASICFLPFILFYGAG
jgi:peptide/nickel transport system substrate-binding protein